MSEELQKPSVLDFEALLAPISEESPSGESLRYSGIYDEIAEARRTDDALAQGEWQTELKVADYRKVIQLATDALTSSTKDIQIAAWLSESLTYQHGFAGLRDGLKLLAGLQENFWDSLHPEIDDGDMEGRGNAISWLDTQCGWAVKKLPITQGAGYSYLDWQDAKRFQRPDNYDSLDNEQQERIDGEIARSEKDGLVNAELWKKARTQTRRQFCEETNFAIEECWEAYRDLNRVLEEKFDRNQVPSMPELSKSLETVHDQVKKILQEKRLEEPQASDDTDAEYTNGEAGEDGGAARGGGGGPISGRADALKKLSEIASFFQRTEPHSPVAYLVQRAVKWGNMPLDSWLRDVIKDDGVLDQIRETLGVGSGSGSGSGDSDSDYDSGDYGSSQESSSDDW